MRLNRDMNSSYLMAGMGPTKIFLYIINLYIEGFITPILLI